MSKKYHHRKTDYDEELDVFEAAKYFSGANETHANSAGKGYVQEKLRTRAAGRLSLDMPSRSSLITSGSGHSISSEKKKQPSSPGGKLAHFLNSLFNQKSSRKKKAKSITTTQSAKDHEDQSPGWRRKRRSSISHFTTATTTTAAAANSGLDSVSRSVYPSHSGPGFRTPPPVKSFKEFRSFSDHQNTKQETTTIHVKSVDTKKINLDYAWLDEKFRFSNRDLPLNCKGGTKVTDQNARIQAKNWNGFTDDGDDGADSDSSSDLFELPNYDLDFCSSGLPVYETTNMNSIKRCSAPIATAAR